VLNFIKGLFTEGYLPVFSQLLSFLPSVTVLLIIVAFFENSKPVLGLGCTTLAVSALDKTEPEHTKRQKIRFLTFIPCSAKLPVFMFLTATVLNLNFFTVIWLYAFSVFLGFVLTRNTAFTFPKFRRIHPLALTKTVTLNLLGFLKRIGIGLIIAVTILYILSHYSFALRPTPTEQSMLYNLCGWAEPLFAPTGLDNAGILAALAFGLIAKEMIIGAILLCPITWTLASGVSFLLFTLLYTPCIPTLTAIASRTSRRHAARVAIFNFAIAYAAAFIAFTALTLLA